MFVNHRFNLNAEKQDSLQSQVPKFGYGQFGEIVFYRTYSRIKPDGGQENWADCVIRVTNGTYSIRKDFYIKNHIPWDEKQWQIHANGFAQYLFDMKWLPPGRGLWAMGSNFVYERGAMALYNCAFTNVGAGEDFVEDVCWIMDLLMHGVGVGFCPLRDSLSFKHPQRDTEDYEIPDTREGWVESVRKILLAFVHGGKLPNLIYDRIRPEGLPIKGFGGISSGPDPLKKLHQLLITECKSFLSGENNIITFKTNITNMVGCCVVAGNVRRSAELALGSVNDSTFLDLKNYNLNPERAEYGWMSNNTCYLDKDEDFDQLGQIASRVINNGEPGVANRRNFRFGRIGKNPTVIDKGIGLNPCGEIILEHREVCNLAETLPTVCGTHDDWYKACEYAAFYCSTVSLLPTNQPSTNRVVARNRRIGVSIIDFSGWKHTHGVHKVTRWLRNGNDVVTQTNKQLNAEAGVPEAIRKTTIKPGGTVPKLAGRTSGCGHPTFVYTLRRIRVQQGTSFHQVLVNANIPHEKDFYSDNTDVFEYPIKQGPAKPAEYVSIWEQANNIVLLQREWADNSVSNTIYFRPKWTLIEHETTSAVSKIVEYIGTTQFGNLIRANKDTYIIPKQTKIVMTLVDKKVTEVKIYEYDPKHEENDVEAVLSSIIPLVKTLSLLPHTPKGVYKQMPEEGISEEEYNERLAAIDTIDWDDLEGSDGIDEKFCSGDTCEVIR